MPTIRIPLVGSFSQRGMDGNAALTALEDQRFLNCLFNVVTNPVTGTSTVFVEKRPGWGVDSIVAAGSASTAMIKPQSFTATVTAFGNTDSTIYVGQINVGAITGRALFFTETLLNSVGIVMIKSSDGTGWYYADGAKDQLAYTMDGNNSTTVTDIKVAGVNSTAGLYVGQKLTAATNIAAGSRIVSINSGAFSAVLDTATTGGAFNDLAVTKEPIAKIIDADFITSGNEISAFVEMDGYLFYSTENGNVWNSDLNSVTSYSSDGFIQPNMSPDPPVAVARQRNYVVVFGGASKEVFYNAGNPTGSPLQRVPQAFERIGCLDQRSLTTLENDIYFVSAPYYGDIGAFKLDGLTTKKISPANIDRIIGNVATGGAIYANSFRLGGYPYFGLFITLAADGPSSSLLLESGDFMLLETGDKILLEDTPAQNDNFVRYLVQNTQLNIWSEWDCMQATYVDGGSAGTANQIYATSRVSTGGKVYTIYPLSQGALYQDDGVTYSLQVRTARMDFGTGRRKFVKEIRLIADTQDAGTALLEKSDDDFQTWQTLGSFDLTRAKKNIGRGGSHLDGRAYRLTHSYPGPFRAEALEIDYEVGSV